ncbi:MAG: hypothetical protein AAGF12_17140 [Myxococcota bacterium]
MRFFLMFATLAGALAGGCAPSIGDSCENSIDCSPQGDRICDTAQPGGYCIVPSCEANTCPEDAVCVEFRFEVARLASSWCMAPCENNGDCRDEYECTRASVLMEDGAPLARILDDNGDDGRRFCVARQQM